MMRICRGNTGVRAKLRDVVVAPILLLVTTGPEVLHLVWHQGSDASPLEWRWLHAEDGKEVEHALSGSVKVCGARLGGAHSPLHDGVLDRRCIRGVGESHSANIEIVMLGVRVLAKVVGEKPPSKPGAVLRGLVNVI